jgi:hypothetical protein
LKKNVRKNQKMCKKLQMEKCEFGFRMKIKTKLCGKRWKEDGRVDGWMMANLLNILMKDCEKKS